MSCTILSLFLKQPYRCSSIPAFALSSIFDTGKGAPSVRTDFISIAKRHPQISLSSLTLIELAGRIRSVGQTAVSCSRLIRLSAERSVAILDTLTCTVRMFTEKMPTHPLRWTACCHLSYRRQPLDAAAVVRGTTHGTAGRPKPNRRQASPQPPHGVDFRIGNSCTRRGPRFGDVPLASPGCV